MPKANFKRLLLILLSLTTLGLIGCSDSNEKKADSLKEAAALQQAGNNDAALATLEKLAEEYPNDPKILRQIGNIFIDQGDHTMAAFFYEQAHQQAPEDVELLYETYKAVDAADQPAGPLLEKLANLAPSSMSPDLWLLLGEHYVEANKAPSALDAYLKGVNPEVAEPSAAVAASIGQLFIELENPAQAEHWLTIAAENDSPDALTALFGLLELKLAQKDWETAEGIIDRLDKQFPGALNASEWATARTELTTWREAQNAMKAELAKAAASREKEAKEAEKATETVTTKTVEETAAITEGKAQIIADMEAAEALANTPAIEVVENAEPKQTVEPAISFNPAITIEPAEPDLTIGVTFDQEATSDPINFSVENSLSSTEEESTNLSNTIDTEPVTSLRGAVEPRSINELLDEAATATIDRNYRLAITNYWQILGIANKRDDVWNLLSRLIWSMVSTRMQRPLRSRRFG